MQSSASTPSCRLIRHTNMGEGEGELPAGTSRFSRLGDEDTLY